MNDVWKWIKEHAKSLAAFLAGILANMVVNLVQQDAAWPQSKEEWLQYLLTSFGAALAAAGVRNKITQEQLDKDKNVVGGIVVDAPQAPPAAPSGSGHDDPWK